MIYGENGIGKSAIIDAVAFLAQSRNALKESIRFAKNFSTLEDMEDHAFRRFFEEQQAQFLLRDLAKNRVQFGSDEPALLKFSGYTGKTFYSYSIAFDHTSVVFESLVVNDKSVFAFDRYGLDGREQSFPLDIPSSLLDIKKMYFGRFSFLACLGYWLEVVDSIFAREHLGETVIAAIQDLFQVECYSGPKTKSRPRLPSKLGLLGDPIGGICPSGAASRISRTEAVLTTFYQSLTNNIAGVHYDVKEVMEGRLKYSLVFVRVRPEGPKNVPFALESHGTQRLLHLLCHLLELWSEEKTVFIDEFDAGIHDLLTKTIIDSFVGVSKGQFVATTHNTHLLSNSNKSFCYVLKREDDLSVTATSLDSFGREIQSGTNVLQRYVRGLYGGVPTNKPFDFARLLEIFSTPA